jgi:hypothetical protein
MHSNVRVVVAVLMLCGAMPVAARDDSCAGISDRSAGAVCHTQNRRGYGSSLERALFHQGPSEDGSVFVQETGDPGSGAYPRLVIWTTLLSEDKMNELIAKGAILDGARKVGFRLLVFVDKGQDRNWYFDLTKPANTPLDVVSPPSPAWMMRSSRKPD